MATKMFENLGPMWRVTPEQQKQNQKAWYQAHKEEVNAKAKAKRLEKKKASQ
jgi:hypothetical protein